MTPIVSPEIDSALCTGCGDCVVACRPGALAMVAGKAVVVHPERCAYDGGCEPVCPVGAIQLPYVIVFDQVEHEETGEGVHEKYLALASALEQKVRV